VAACSQLLHWKFCMFSISYFSNVTTFFAGGKEAEGVWEQGVEENIWT
jgi:hypothetical protein